MREQLPDATIIVDAGVALQRRSDCDGTRR